MKSPRSESSELIVADVDHWRRWLAENHGVSSGVNLVLAKKGVVAPTSLTYDQALEEALCFGWIDGQLQGRDDATYRRRFTPRQPRAAWSQRNVELVGRLERLGRMQPSGIAEVERAKADGRWKNAYSGQASASAPADLAAALAENSKAGAAFERLTKQNRYSILYRLETAKRAETRAKRIEQFVAMLARGDTIHPQ